MSVRYTSTRGKHSDLSFEEVVLGGLANDKGLFVPVDVPTFTLGEIEDMRRLSFCDLAFEVMSKFIDDRSVPASDLKSIITKSFSSFRSADVTPVVKCQEFFVLELFHGPTFAFKDVALQFLGNLFEFFLTRGNLLRKLTIIGATSGDTGSAAIHGLRGKANVDCFIMFPTGKVTEIQERQMTTITDSNIHCMSIDGDFDDCQALVKAAFADAAFREEVSLGAVNSINWARVLAQITYYFFSWLRVTDSTSNDNATAISTPDVLFAVPTGNFGDILAGYYAKRMGLPIGKLMICTNQNDVLHRFFETGEYRKSPAVPTMAPSMDISVSSNFERYLYYLADESGEELAQWMEIFEATGVLTVSRAQLQRARHDFCSFAASREVILSTMTQLFDKEGYLVCPHTATAVAGLQNLIRQHSKNAESAGEDGVDERECGNSLDGDTILMCLATAHPAKFEAAVQLALQESVRPHPARPPELEVLFGQETRKVHLANSLGEVQAFVRQNVHAYFSTQS